MFACDRRNPRRRRDLAAVVAGDARGVIQALESERLKQLVFRGYSKDTSLRRTEAAERE